MRRAAPWLLLALTIASFSPALDQGFVNWDDDKNILQNPHFQGLGVEKLRWMFTAVHLGHYHPLTWVSWGLDYLLWGLNPRGYHLTNLALHAANALLLYWIARRLLGGRVWAAALSALLFAVHPLRVESVVWVSERRDVLCGLFALASVLAYLKAHQEGPRGRWMAVSLAAFAAALLSKVIAVAVPIGLLILDWCLLRRRAWAEKIPYAVLAVLSGLIGIALQPAGVAGFAGHVSAQLPLRLALSIYALGFYVWKSIAPFHLYAQYVMAPRISVFDWRILLSALLVGTLTILAVRRRKQQPALLGAWLYYVAALLPVLSLVRLDPQQYVADHHSYLATIGFGLLAGPALERRRAPAIAAAAALMILTWRQTGVWRDSITLWAHTAGGQPYSATAHNNLGEALAQAGRLAEAIPHFRRATELQPGHAHAYYNLGQGLLRLGQVEAAAGEFRRAVELEPAFAAAHNDLANCYVALGRAEAALLHYHKALEAHPGLADAHYNLGNLLQTERRFEEAISHYREAVRLNPALADAHNNWGVALDELGRRGEAMDHYRQALALNPRHADAHNNLGLALEMSGRIDEAMAHYREALRWNPSHAGAAANLARHLSR